MLNSTQLRSHIIRGGLVTEPVVWVYNLPSTLAQWLDERV